MTVYAPGKQEYSLSPFWEHDVNGTHSERSIPAIMTLVATIKGDGLPILIGDLLLSGRRDNGGSLFHVPTVGEICSGEGLEGPVSLIQ